MHNTRQYIEVRGERRELLFTPSLYKIAKDRGWSITATSNFADIQSAYIKLIYAAAVNSYEVNKFDNPDTPELGIQLIDIEEWAMINREQFGKLIVIAAELMTGKTMKELIDVEKKKRRRSFLSFLTLHR